MPDLTPNPCPNCKKDPTSNTCGSYVKGFLAQVCCYHHQCGIQGPLIVTSAYSDNEHENEQESIQAWNNLFPQISPDTA